MFSLGTIRKLNAEEVRRRAEAAKKAGPNIAHLIGIVEKAINNAADDGKMMVDKNPLSGLRMIITNAQSAKLWKLFRSRGFTIKISRGAFRISW